MADPTPLNPIETNQDKENREFFIRRVEETFALNEDHKRELLAQIDSLDYNEMDRILSVIVHFEWLILRDEKNSDEAKERDLSIQAGEDLLKSLNF